MNDTTVPAAWVRGSSDFGLFGKEYKHLTEQARAVRTFCPRCRQSQHTMTVPAFWNTCYQLGSSKLRLDRGLVLLTYVLFRGEQTGN